MVTELNDNNFDEFLGKHSKVLVDCWAPWCGPCRRMGPIIEEVAEDLGDSAGIAKLNTDDNHKISAKFGIRAIPTLLVFKDGVLVDTIVGLRPKEDIIEYMNKM